MGEEAPSVAIPIPTALPASTLHHNSKTSNNARYKNLVPHNYPLRSRTRLKNNIGTNIRHLAEQYWTTQHMFQPKVHHIFKENRQKETIDTLLNSINKDV